MADGADDRVPLGELLRRPAVWAYIVISVTFWGFGPSIDSAIRFPDGPPPGDNPAARAHVPGFCEHGIPVTAFTAVELCAATFWVRPVTLKACLWWGVAAGPIGSVVTGLNIPLAGLLAHGDVSGATAAFFTVALMPVTLIFSPFAFLTLLVFRLVTRPRSSDAPPTGDG